MKTKITIIGIIVTIAIVIMAYSNFFKAVGKTTDKLEKGIDSQISELMKY
ncbi:hypothetical protein [Peptoniphilus porci]|nr:hypothetical protein [Peptoniphilus porci]